MSFDENATPQLATPPGYSSFVIGLAGATAPAGLPPAPVCAHTPSAFSPAALIAESLYAPNAPTPAAGGPERLEPPFTDLSALRLMPVDELIKAAGCSTSGVSSVEVLKAVVMAFFRANERTVRSRATSKNPRLPKEYDGLKTLFSANRWKDARTAGMTLPNERTVGEGGVGQYAYSYRRLGEWLVSSQLPDAPILLSILTDPEFNRFIDSVRRPMDQLAKARGKSGQKGHGKDTIIRRGVSPSGVTPMKKSQGGSRVTKRATKPSSCARSLNLCSRGSTVSPLVTAEVEAIPALTASETVAFAAALPDAMCKVELPLVVEEPPIVEEPPALENTIKAEEVDATMDALMSDVDLTEKIIDGNGKALSFDEVMKLLSDV